VEIDAHLDALDREGALLADGAARGSLSDPVPGCPDWTVRDLVSHIGEVHRWAAAIVAGALADPNLPAVDAAPGEDQLLDWYREGHHALVTTLRAAPADLACFTFLPAPSPLAFWARRQALETAVHRADAYAAAGQPVAFDDELAHDGIDEILTGFGARPRAFEAGTIRLEPGSGPAWLVSLTADGAKCAIDAADSPADVVVAGEASQLYLWLWNRPATVSISGDPAVASRWSQLRIRWS
jgi:uncharacterized protein (TIGR03083 family)